MSTEVELPAASQSLAYNTEYDHTIWTFSRTEHRVSGQVLTVTANGRTGMTVTKNGSPVSPAEHPKLALIGLVGLFWTTLVPLIAALSAILFFPVIGVLSPVLFLIVVCSGPILDTNDSNVNASSRSIRSPRDVPLAYTGVFLLTCVVSVGSYTLAGVFLSNLLPWILPAITLVIVGSVLRTIGRGVSLMIS